MLCFKGEECRHWTRSPRRRSGSARRSRASRAWLGKLENITVGHGVSLLQWRSGGENTPTIRRPTLSCRHQLLRIAHNRLVRDGDARAVTNSLESSACRFAFTVGGGGKGKRIRA